MGREKVRDSALKLFPIGSQISQPALKKGIYRSAFNYFSIRLSSVICMIHITSENCWKDFKQALESLSSTEKGRVFEELTRLYLLTEPTFATKIKKIWHHSDVPQKIVDELGLQRPEIGVDLIAQVKDGTYWAIQCKYHSDPTRNVSYKELSTFFSITERSNTSSKLSHRLICTSANGVSHNAEKAHPDKLGYLTSADFSKLGQSEFDVFRKLLGGGKLILDPFYPREHQEVALKEVEKFFSGNENTRGKIIHPCGSGKSLTGYWISQMLKSKKIIIAVPSLALVRQTLGIWTREALANDIEVDWIAVCSDDDVKNSDDPSMSRVDLGIEVDTDPEVIAAFLSKRSKGTKVLITTYQSGQAVSAGVNKADFTFDLAIYDEAHKTVGQKDKPFSHLIYDENVKVKKRIFMTATEREFRGNSDEYNSMDDESIYGPIIHQLSFKKALEQYPPILSDYKIVSTIVTKSEVQQLLDNNAFVKSDGKNWSVEGDATTIAGLIVLRKLIKERDIKHVVSFHSSIKRSKDFMKLNTEISKADNTFGHLNSFHVSGRDSTGDRAAELERFVDAVPSLITNARCLTEGVDIPAIDGVLFADPKQSRIDIVQAAGRALRKYVGKDFGYIIVPVVLDEEMDDPSNEAFKHIITVISALGMNDERIIEEFREVSKRNKCNHRIVVFDIPEIVRIKFENFISNLEIQIWDRLSFGWHKGFDKLKIYVRDNKNARVPSGYEDSDGFKLGNWVSDRRKNYNKGNLSPDRVSALEAVEGWVWDIDKSNFQEGLEKLKIYIRDNKNAQVPQNYEDSDGFKLGNWVSDRRKKYNKGNLSSDRVLALEAVEGWVWDIDKSNFQEGFEKLNIYVRDNKNAQVPQNYEDSDGFKLGNWVSDRRRKYNKGNLSSDRVLALEAVEGWVWDIDKRNFQEGFEKLNIYVRDNKNAQVPQNYEDSDGFKLGNWVSDRRRKYNKGNLSSDRVLALEAVEGWVWDIDKRNFQEGFEKLNIYVRDNKNARVPSGYEDSDGFKLGNWVSDRRKKYNKGNLSSDRVLALEAVEGWVWDIDKSNFQEGFEKLNIYVRDNKNAQVPQNYEDSDGFKLGNWVSDRRRKYNKGNLSSDRVLALEAVEGWVWDIDKRNFQEGFEKLNIYVRDNKNAQVPQNYEDSDGFKLGNWVSDRRRKYNKGNLSSDRVLALEAVEGWVWDIDKRNFQEGFEKLNIYVRDNKNARVPSGYEDSDGFKLGNWVSDRRRKYNKGDLSSDRVLALEAVEGWVWDANKRNFQKGLEKLKIYVRDNKNARVPSGYEDSDGFKLGNWVNDRRRDYNKGKLSSDRVLALEAFDGWVWDVDKRNFQEGLEKLKIYVRDNKNARVPSGYEDSDDFKLGNWVNDRRRNYNKGKLSSDRVLALEAVEGWVWDCRRGKFPRGS